MPSATSKRLKPPALRPGDTVGIVAPASNIKRDDLEAGCENLRRAGYVPFYEESIFEQDLYFAGSHERRTRELQVMLARDDVRAIICARGGYGANYLLDRLDLKHIQSTPKIFVGYSDVTCLLTRLIDATGLVCFHGPMAAKDWAHAGGVDFSSWQLALSSASAWDVPLNAEVKSLQDGKAEGILYGGCLSILVSSLGTPHAIRTDNTILFLEDIAAKPYQIDRMLMQLKLGGYLKKVRALVFGEMLDCRQVADQGYTLEEVVMRIVGDLDIPVVFGVRSGHVTRGNITLPFGVSARISARGSQVSLRILESVVTP